MCIVFVSIIKTKEYHCCHLSCWKLSHLISYLLPPVVIGNLNCHSYVIIHAVHTSLLLIEKYLIIWISFSAFSFQPTLGYHNQSCKCCKTRPYLKSHLLVRSLSHLVKWAMEWHWSTQYFVIYIFWSLINLKSDT